MIAEMRMQMGLPELALAALVNVMKLYPNRFNSIANAAAAAAASAFAVTPPLGPQDTAFRSLVSAAPINPLVVPPVPSSSYPFPSFPLLLSTITITIIITYQNQHLSSVS